MRKSLTLRVLNYSQPLIFLIGIPLTFNLECVAYKVHSSSMLDSLRILSKSFTTSLKFFFRFIKWYLACGIIEYQVSRDKIDSTSFNWIKAHPIIIEKINRYQFYVLASPIYCYTFSLLSSYYLMCTFIGTLSLIFYVSHINNTDIHGNEVDIHSI